MPTRFLISSCGLIRTISSRISVKACPQNTRAILIKPSITCAVLLRFSHRMKGLQNEVKRLIQKKDGVEPQKVHLTRGAFIKMYMRGDLFDQAIAEAMIGVRENPQRMDYHAGFG